MDYSFLRLKPTLAEAFDLEDSPVANIFSRAFVCLRSDETYLQITNSDVDIVFNGDQIVHIADTCGNDLLNITSKVNIYEGINSETGIRNVAFELVNIGKSFYTQPVILKFTSSFDPDLVFYSNPFVIHDGINGTARFDYRSIGVAFGVDYFNFDFMQGIRLMTYYTKPTNETEKKTYIQTSGTKISPKSTIVVAYNYQMEWLSNFYQEALIRLVENSIIFIDGVRATTVSFSTDDIEGTSNFYKGKLTAYKNKNDKYTPTTQIT